MPDIIQYTGGDLETHGYLLPTAHGMLAFDAPEGFAREIQNRKMTVNALLLTHGHFDHIWDAAEIQQQHQCPVFIHPRDAMMLADPTVFRAFGIPDFPGVKQYQELHMPDKGAIPWEQGGHRFILFHIPGHSLGSVAFYEKSQGFVIGGDVLFAGGIGRWDFPGGSERDLISGIRQHLLTLPDDTRVYPGHGPLTTIGIEKKSNFYLR